MIFYHNHPLQRLKPLHLNFYLVSLDQSEEVLSYIFANVVHRSYFVWGKAHTYLRVTMGVVWVLILKRTYGLGYFIFCNFDAHFK